VLKKKKFLIGGIIILIAIGSLAFMWFRNSATYYYSVADAINRGTTLQGQTIRLAGQVAPGSVMRDDSTGVMDFKLVDTTNAADVVTITYKGGVPDSFKEGNDAVVEGQLSSMKTFDATQIIVKCPSKYVAKQ
jgi:cytochrome c-type biogenesis protein CcmE